MAGFPGIGTIRARNTVVTGGIPSASSIGHHTQSEVGYDRVARVNRRIFSGSAPNLRDPIQALRNP